MAGTAVDFLLVYLKQLINCKEFCSEFPEGEKLQIVSVYEDLSSLRTFLIDSDMSWHKHDELKDLVFRITDMANEAEDIIDSDIIEKNDGVYISGMLIKLPNEIESLSKELSELYDESLISSSRASVDYVLEYLKQLMGFMDLKVLQIKSLYGLRLLNDSDSEMSWYKHHDVVEFTNLVKQISFMADMTKYIISYPTNQPSPFGLDESPETESEKVFGMLINLQNQIEYLREEVHVVWISNFSDFATSNLSTRASVVLKHLKRLIEFIEFNGLQIKSIYEGLTSFRPLFNDSEMSWYKHYEELKDLVIQVADMANMAKRMINHPYIIKDFVEKKDGVYNISRMLINLKKEIESLRDKNSNSSSRASKFFMLNYSKEICNQCNRVKKLQIKSVHEEVSSLSIFLQHSEMILNQHKEFLYLVTRITAVAKEAKNIFDMSVESDIIEKKDCVAGTFSHVYQFGMLVNVLKEIQSLKKEVSKIYEKKLYGIGDPHVGMYFGESSSSSTSSSSRAALHIVQEEETVVGFDNDVETIRERLAGGSKQLDVISIVGMAGSGKTTLAKQLYNDAFVLYHFYIRGWTYVSQVYAKRDLLLSILSSVVEHRDALYSMTDKKLVEELYKSLKGKRYLIVMDDIWDTRAWNDLEKLFPNDNNGSRIIITSRLTEVALHAKPDSHPHPLHFLTHDESWELLKHKVFGKESCPPDLVEIGEQIAQKCQGLPLAIVVVAGLLARRHKKKEEWEKVAGSLSSNIATGDPEQCMNNTLELSYYHLPRHLRLCFLYFGAFPEDYEICVRKLVWLWIAEGFIHPTGHKTLEDLAEEFLTDLIGRSLVLVAKRKFSGGIRACRVHDLLRDLCLRKGKEENFMQQIYVHETLSPNLSHPSSCLNPIEEKQRRLCIFSNPLEYISLKHCPLHIRSLLSFFPTEGSVCRRNLSCIYRALKLLRVLDLSAILIRNFPSEILQLVLLRYLELRVTFHFTLPESISDLLNLEMLRVSPPKDSCVGLPYGIWKMVNLRHLRIDAGCKDFFGNKGYPSVLHNLQTILYLLPSMSCQEILERTPNLRKLGFCGYFLWDLGSPNLHFLNHLETLKLLNRERVLPSSKKWSLQAFKFPPNLRRLTLSNTNLDWEDMSTLGMLCNLEVLKLEYSACVGRWWKTTSEGFGRLKFLRLRHINIEQWEASSTDFPSLQQLVLQGCRELEGIPLDFGNIPTLQTIEVTRCSQSTENSARKIQEEQKDMGNDWLKILINS